MAGPFELPALPYAEDALTPVISAQTVSLHYGKHHKTYFDKLNGFVEGTAMAEMTLEELIIQSKGDDKLKGVFNNAGQAWNHILYWEQFAKSGARVPSATLSEFVERDFGSFDAMKAEFVACAANTFGSGWAWLVLNDNKLELLSTSNADNPLAHGKVALCGLDVWEHAYYLDYQNRRPDHCKAVLDEIVNWSYVGEKLEAAL